ncbi:Globin [Aphelenchoides besseyi]|nr:Globin [Aphelenchoides besseyi]
MYRMEHITRMTKEEKDLLRVSWKVLRRQINDLGREIFDMIFAQSPDTKALFPFTNFAAPKSEKVLKEIEFHGRRFMEIIETTVEALDNMVKAEPILDNLGRRHGRLTENRGFSAHHWNVFIECSLFHFRTVLSEDKHFRNIVVIDKVMILWRILLKTIIKRMKIGLQQDLKNRKAHRESVNEFDGLTISSMESGSSDRRGTLCKSLMNSSSDSE